VRLQSCFFTTFDREKNINKAAGRCSKAKAHRDYKKTGPWEGKAKTPTCGGVCFTDLGAPRTSDIGQNLSALGI
jgi:hypothetical protein